MKKEKMIKAALEHFEACGMLHNDALYKFVDTDDDAEEAIAEHDMTYEKGRINGMMKMLQIMGYDVNCESDAMGNFTRFTVAGISVEMTRGKGV